MSLNAAFVNAEGDPCPPSQDTTTGEILRATNQEYDQVSSWKNWYGGAVAAQQRGPNDALDHFNTRGLRGLYTPIEVNKSMPSVLQQPCPAAGFHRRFSNLCSSGWDLGVGFGRSGGLQFWFREELGFCCSVCKSGIWDQGSHLKCDHGFRNVLY